MPPGGAGAAPTQVYADSAQILQNRLYRLQGNVVLERPGERLRGDRATYDRRDDTVAVDGNVRYRESQMAVSGSRGKLKIGTSRGSLNDARYLIPGRHAHGRAQQMRLEGPGLKRLQQATYTTCDPGHDDWLLSARQVRLFQKDGVGTARDVKLDFKGVPILYTPYMSFPLNDRRKSGFLTPSIGSSSNGGTDLRLPYYWNIAPNRDATFTPRIITKRGVLLGTEFRYLNPRNHGTLNLQYLPSDREFGADRSLVSFDHTGRPTSRLDTRVIYNEVSDPQYFQDLGDNLGVASITHLERRADATYHGPWWYLLGRVQDFQTLDTAIAPANRPYQRMPQLVFQSTPPLHGLGLSYHFDAEAVRFARPDNPPGDPTGTRLDLKPRITLPLGGNAYFFKPAAELEYTRYQLDNTAPGQATSPTRTVPLLSVDSGLFFERNLKLGGRRYIQTLEPRAYYLYVPYRNQNDIPVFDTGLYDFNLQQMFQPNRFSGPDRVGDANQVTLALTSRLLDSAAGTQRLSASLGEIIYFHDRRVTLSPGTTPDTQSTSNLVGQLDAQMTRNWQGNAGVQWDPHRSRTERASVALRYRRDDRHVANLAYRFRRDVIQQTDLSAAWPLSPAWLAVARWNYSLRDSQTVDAFAGVQYDSCCWALRVVGRNYINGFQGQRNTAVYLQLVLKGLGSLGNPVETLLENGILGYRVKP